jgi:DNA-binding HxlR family transcriptional regulator
VCIGEIMTDFNFKGKKFNNPVELSLAVIGGKWKIPIIWRLKDGSQRYGELRRSLSKVTHKMLTQQLRELEQDEILKRKVYPEVPPKVEYSLTLLGESVIPVIDMLKEWGDEYRKVFEK